MYVREAVWMQQTNFCREKSSSSAAIAVIVGLAGAKRA